MNTLYQRVGIPWWKIPKIFYIFKDTCHLYFWPLPLFSNSLPFPSPSPSHKHCTYLKGLQSNSKKMLQKSKSNQKLFFFSSYSRVIIANRLNISFWISVRLNVDYFHVKDFLPKHKLLGTSDLQNCKSIIRTSKRLLKRTIDLLIFGLRETNCLWFLCSFVRLNGLFVPILPWSQLILGRGQKPA